MINLDIKQLETFLTVAKLLSFRAASEELNYSQSTVSDHIRNLEAELNVKLFERLGKKVFLNEQGEKLIPAAKKIMQDATDLRSLFNEKAQVRGVLTIGAAETLCVSWLPPLLKAYRSKYPDVQIILKMANCLEFPTMLEKNMIDIAFSLHDESSQPQLHQLNLFTSPVVIVASPNHPLTHLRQVELRQLQNDAFILTEPNSGYSLLLRQEFERLNIKINTIMELNSLEAIKQCVKNELGITVLPRIVVDKELKSQELTTLPVTIKDFNIHAKMIYHQKKWLSPPLAALQNIIKNGE